MKKELFILEEGVLLTEKCDEFEYYKIHNFYEEFGFFDKNRLVFFDYEMAKKYADSYIKKGVNMTYVIIWSGIFNIDDAQEQEIKDSLYCEQCLDNPSIEDTMFFAYKENEKIITMKKRG